MGQDLNFFKSLSHLNPVNQMAVLLNGYIVECEIIEPILRYCSLTI